MSTVTSPKTPNKGAVRLSATSYLVLGLIGLRGPSTSYDLKSSANRSVAYFWPFPHSQLYSEPARLAAAGLLTQQREEGGRHRVLYSLTPAGKRSLEAWTRRPQNEVFEMRDMSALQLFFSEFIATEDLVRIAQNQAQVYRARLEVYQQIGERNAGKAGRERRMAPLDLGMRLARVCQEFWDDIAAHPPPLPVKKRRSS